MAQQSTNNRFAFILIIVIIILFIIVILNKKNDFTEKTISDCEALGGFCAQECSDEYDAVESDCQIIGVCCMRKSVTGQAEIIEGELFQ